jgi:hypothetical protein
MNLNAISDKQWIIFDVSASYFIISPLLINIAQKFVFDNAIYSCWQDVYI